MEEIRKNIFFVHGEGKGRFPFSHSVLIKDGINVLIDAGFRRLCAHFSSVTLDSYRPGVLFLLDYFPGLFSGLLPIVIIQLKKLALHQTLYRILFRLLD